MDALEEQGVSCLPLVLRCCWNSVYKRRLVLDLVRRMLLRGRKQFSNLQFQLRSDTWVA